MEGTIAEAGDKAQMFLAWLCNPVNQMLMAPLFGCIIICLINPRFTRAIKAIAVLASSLSLVSAVLLITGVPAALRSNFAFLAQYEAFRPEAGYQFLNRFNWITFQHSEFQGFGVQYFVAVDGLSLPLVVMSAAVILLAVVWSLYRTERVRDYYALMLLMACGLLGVFVAMDYVLFYLFWELMLIPMYFLIAGWGKNREAANKAAIKFFVYTLFGSVFLLIAFIAIQVFSSGAGVFTYSIPDTASYMRNEGLAIPYQMRLLMFLGLLVAFAVKAPMFPLHTWLPDAHSEAPAEVSVILAAIMLKTGTYAYLRILYPTFPDIGYSMGPIIALCGLVAIVYGAAVTLVQTDFKRMVAYSSISHMGFIILGMSVMSADSVAGSIFHMVGHGIIIATLFFLTGVVQRIYGTLDMRKIAGMLNGARPYAVILGIGAFAGMGLPGLVGFIGELLIIKGTFFNSAPWSAVHIGALDGARYLQIAAAVSILGILIGGVFMINMLQRVMPGDFNGDSSEPRHLRLTDGIALVPLVVFIVLLGLFPKPVLDACTPWSQVLYLISQGNPG